MKQKNEELKIKVKMSFSKNRKLNSFCNENDISVMIKQISEPTFHPKKTQRSYSFLTSKQPKRIDSSLANSNSVSASFSSTDQFTNHQPENSYLFSRQLTNNGSFMRRNFIKTKSSLLNQPLEFKMN